MKSEFYQKAEEIFALQGLDITPEQLKLFEQFYDIILDKNKVMNLTRITSPEEAAQKHFFDSVSLLKYIDFPKNACVIDIGTGAGFPALPVKIMRPDIQLTAVDSSAKKIAFLSEASHTLGLNIEAIAARAEELANNSRYRESFHIVLSRAVASLPVLLELCIPFVRKGGLFIAYKGSDHEKELTLSKTALIKLKSCIKEIFHPFEQRDHALMVFQKLEFTPKIFPRKFSQIKNRPL